MTEQATVQRARAHEAIVSAILARRGSLRFQPVFRVGAEGRSLAFHEALLRLSTPKGAEILPAAFLPVAAQVGLLPEIDAMAFDLATALLRRTESLRLSVNVHPESLGHPLVMARLAALPTAEADRLILEVTEAAPLTEPALAAIAAARGTGAMVLMDDFGAGCSSLRHILERRVDGIKLDRCLVSGIAREGAKQTVVRAMIDLCRNLDLTIIAEGIEEPEEADWLRRSGIHGVQGYYYGTPAPAPVRLVGSPTAALRPVR